MQACQLISIIESDDEAQEADKVVELGDEAQGANEAVESGGDWDETMAA